MSQPYLEVPALIGSSRECEGNFLRDGEDANWGRIVMAVGKAGEPADRDKLAVAVGGTWVAKEGGVVPGYDETPVVAHMKGHEIEITVDIGLGKGKGTAWTCDLTHGYIDINGSYRS
jgi:glutamate N-acetyltransferase/amino-acid N-acetyltransferase